MTTMARASRTYPSVRVTLASTSRSTSSGSGVRSRAQNIRPRAGPRLVTSVAPTTRRRQRAVTRAALVRQGWACPCRRLSASLTATSAIPTVMIPIASAELEPVKITTTPASISTMATTLKAQHGYTASSLHLLSLLDARAAWCSASGHPRFRAARLRCPRLDTTPTMTVNGVRKRLCRS